MPSAPPLNASGAAGGYFPFTWLLPHFPSLLLIARSNHPGFGLAPLVCSAAGALSAVQPGGRLHWGLWYLTPSALGWRKLSSGVFMAVGLWMAYETLRIGLTQWQLMPMLLSLSVMFLSASTSYLLASLLFIPKIDAKLEQLQSIASGKKSRRTRINFTEGCIHSLENNGGNYSALSRRAAPRCGAEC